MGLIDKSALLAKIKSIENETNYESFTDEVLGKREVCKKIKDFIDTLETIEVDLKDERMKDCPYRLVGCARYSHTITKCDGACAWVVDYPRLKELKTRNGE